MTTVKYKISEGSVPSLSVAVVCRTNCFRRLHDVIKYRTFAALRLKFHLQQKVNTLKTQVC